MAEEHSQWHKLRRVPRPPGGTEYDELPGHLLAGTPQKVLDVVRAELARTLTGDADEVDPIADAVVMALKEAGYLRDGRGHTQEFYARRTAYGVMSGHYGGEGWTATPPDVEFRSGSVGGPSLEQIIGRMVGSGSKVKVTVEVLSEEPVTVNPWHQPDREGHRWRTIPGCPECTAEKSG